MRHLSIVLLLFAAARATAETTKKPPQKPKEVVELEALEIKVRPQEPTLMYILEQPSFDFRSSRTSCDGCPSPSKRTRYN